MKVKFFVLLIFVSIALTAQDTVTYEPPDSVEIDKKYNKGISFVVPISYEKIGDMTYVNTKQVGFEFDEEDLVEHNGKTYFIVPKREFWKKFKKLK